MRIVRSLASALARQWMGALALVMVLGTGTAYAASATWTGDNIVDGSLTGADVQDGSLSGTDIQNGSITSSDLAAGATSGGGATPALQFDSAGPYTWPADLIGPTQLDSQSFDTASAGFFNFYSVANLSGPTCGGDEYEADADIVIDGQNLGGQSLDEYLGVGHVGGTSRNAIYLAAGTHTMEVRGTMPTRCTTSSDNITMTDLHVLLMPAQ